MLRLTILSIGKDKDGWITEGCDHYLKLLSRYARVEMKLLPSLKSTSSLSAKEIKAGEANLLSRQLTSGYLVALHDQGERFDSPGFARKLEHLQTESEGKVTLVIGGAFGLDQRIIQKAHLVLSLSKLTFSHQLTRLILLEQLYRGFSILHGTAYHK